MLNDVVLSSSEHNHAPDPAKNEAAKVVSAIRKRAVEGVEKPRQIIQQARAGISMEVAPHLPAYVASQRKRSVDYTSFLVKETEQLVF